MIYRLERKKQWFAGVLGTAVLAAALLSGCGSAAPASFPEVPDTTVPDETEQELLGDKLEKQLLAILNLGRQEDEQVVSDDQLEAVADFYLEAALEDPQAYPADGQYRNVNGEKNCYFLVYDGALPSIEAGDAIQASLKELDQKAALYYGKLQNLEVAYGRNEDRAVWLVVAYYPIQT